MQKDIYGQATFQKLVSHGCAPTTKFKFSDIICKLFMAINIFPSNGILWAWQCYQDISIFIEVIACRLCLINSSCDPDNLACIILYLFWVFYGGKNNRWLAIL